MWKQEPGQLLQNTLLTLISQTGTDLFWLYVCVRTPTHAREKLRSSGLQPPALTSLRHLLKLVVVHLWPVLGDQETKVPSLTLKRTYPHRLQMLVGSGKVGRKR